MYKSNTLVAGRIRSLHAEGTRIIAGSYAAGMYFSTNNGVSWDSANGNIGSISAATIGAYGDTVFGVYMPVLEAGGQRSVSKILLTK